MRARSWLIILGVLSAAPAALAQPIIIPLQPQKSDNTQQAQPSAPPVAPPQAGPSTPSGTYARQAPAAGPRDEEAYQPPAAPNR